MSDQAKHGEQLALEAIERFREDTRTLVSRANVDPTVVVLGLMAAAVDVAVEQLQRDPRLFGVYGSACKVAIDRMVTVLAPGGLVSLKH